MDPGELTAKILSRVYAYLKEDSRVVRPGSVRSFEAALNDIMMRIVLEGGVDYEKYKEIVTRVGIENLYLSVETVNPEDKVYVLREAFMRAFEEFETSPAQLSSEESGGGESGGVSGYRVSEGEGSEEQGEGGSQEVGVDYRLGEEQRGNAGGNESPTVSGLVSSGNKESTANFDSVVTTIYEILYGGVGTVNFLNLAQLINMFIDPYANITEKVKVLRKIEPYLRSYGLVPTEGRRGREGERVFEALRNVVRNAMSGVGQVKVVRFTDVDRYPTYVVSIREYKIGDSYFDMDMQRTSMNIARKVMMNKPFTSRDIVVKEYANIKTIDIVLCLDVSGSMRELSNGMPKIEIAKDAITQYIQFLAKTNDRLAMVLFNFRADVLWPLAPVRKYWSQMKYMLKYVYAGGGTNLANALEKSRDVLTRSRSNSKHVICVTDGRTVNSSMCIREAVRLRRGGTTISTIAIGENSDDELLMRLSKLGGGLFIKISNIHDLGRALIMDKLHGM